MLRWILIIALAVTHLAVGAEPVLNVSAAISLREILEKSAIDFKDAGGGEIRFNFGASGVLATQIEQGAEADIFISAAHRQMDQLVEKGLIDRDSRIIVAKNELVLIAPAGAKQIKSLQDLTADAVRKIAIGEPRTVPAGEYAMQTLEGLKIAAAVGPKLIYGASVRQVLDYVARGEVEAGFVYRTDAIVAGDKVNVVAVADETWHKPIEYPAAMTSASPSKELARKYLAFLTSEAGTAAFCKAGFATTLTPATQTTTAPTTIPATHPTTQSAGQDARQ